ncbi:MAG: permease [Opitutales bacterium]|nr:permease [Opitutales bacterium]MBP3357495.1 US12 family protein [Opitutales bacterium]MBQ2721521.1 US12 family protein [Opitutales bacterium]MBR7105391.1 US12 family protein [Opitutales bacterium]
MQNNIDIQFERTSAEASARSLFLKKTYLHLALAFIVFICVEAMLLNWQPAVELAGKMVSGNNWLIVLLAFMGVSWLANSWATSATSLGKQFAGLYLYVFAEAIIFLPLLLVANAIAPDAIIQAGVLTASLSGGITAYVFLSGKSFSYLGSFLTMASFIALGIIVCSMLFGFQLGLWFSIAMVVFASIAVLYQTGAVIHQYRNDQYVAAALGLFASIALMFWYILQILMANRR